MTVYDRIIDLLETHGAEYRTLHHAPTRTSQESADVRGEPIENGAKAIVLKVDDWFGLFVLSAALRVNSNVVCRHLGARRSRFATREELHELTGLVPGCVPPFGRPVLDLDCWVDPSILGRERIAFNAGRLTDSVIMPSSEYRRIATFESFAFSRA